MNRHYRQYFRAYAKIVKKLNLLNRQDALDANASACALRSAACRRLERARIRRVCVSHLFLFCTDSSDTAFRSITNIVKVYYLNAKFDLREYQKINYPLCRVG